MLAAVACLATLGAAAAGKAPPPPPPALTFSDTLDDYTVLQQTPSDACLLRRTSALTRLASRSALAPALAPPRSAPSTQHCAATDLVIFDRRSRYVYGATTSDSVTVKVSGAGCPSLSAKATVFNHTWKAKVPGPKGGDCTVIATDDKGNTANLTHVTYGDVWCASLAVLRALSAPSASVLIDGCFLHFPCRYCGGQSNMALPVAHTFSRNITAKAVLGGKYANIRLKQIGSNMNTQFKWMTLHDAVSQRLVAEHGKVNSTYFELFSATCYYCGESLTEELGADAPPLGLVHTAFGGSMIEQWLTEDTVASCKNSSNYTASNGGEWWQARVLPYSQMTLKGWLWYRASATVSLRSFPLTVPCCAISEGENNMHAPFGNSLLGTGYACMMAKLVSTWRALWSKSSGTDSMAPFGLVTLAASGGEGGADIGSMRLAQTARCGCNFPSILTYYGLTLD